MPCQNSAAADVGRLCTYLLIHDGCVFLRDAVGNANDVCWLEDAALVRGWHAVNRGVVATLIIAEAAVNRVEEKVEMGFRKIRAILIAKVDNLLWPNDGICHLIVQGCLLARPVQRSVGRGIANEVRDWVGSIEDLRRKTREEIIQVLLGIHLVFVLKDAHFVARVAECPFRDVVHGANACRRHYLRAFLRTSCRTHDLSTRSI